MSPDNLLQTQENSQPSKNGDGNSDERTLSLLQKIQTGSVDPKCIRPAERRQIVSYLMADGYCTADMAQILKVSDRSVERDKKAIRQANLSIQRIRKAVRDKKTKTAVKIDAEHRCYQIVSDMISSLQRLGYLPIATARLQADLTHNIGEIPALTQMQAEVKRLKQITGEIQKTDPQLTEQLNQIETQLIKVKLADKIENISNIVESKEVQNESDQ